MSADAHTIPTPQATYAQRVAFVSEIAGRLHSYGTTAQRLETAVVALARQLDLDCEPWSNPTGIILSFSDPAQAIGSSDITRVIRLAPGENDLHKLSVADHIAEEVANGRMSIAQGHTALRQLDKDRAGAASCAPFFHSPSARPAWPACGSCRGWTSPPPVSSA